LNTYRKWNQGHIIYPDTGIATQMERIGYNHIVNFSGDPKNKDDIVDALVAAYDEQESSNQKFYKMSDNARYMQNKGISL
jgi:hypothetical protein